jgi:hypothetical protein
MSTQELTECEQHGNTSHPTHLDPTDYSERAHASDAKGEKMLRCKQCRAWFYPWELENHT